MLNSRTHPADSTLILAIDHELSRVRRVALDEHLTACQECRSRFEAFQDAARNAARVCRDCDAGDPAAMKALRRRLEKRMMEAEGHWNRSVLFRCRKAAGRVPRVARMGITVVLLVFVVKLLEPAVHLAAPPIAQHTSLPINHFTPGATSNVSVSDLCAGTLPAQPHLPIAVRQAVLANYQMEQVASSEYELDLLITPELGGVADVRNIWPERY